MDDPIKDYIIDYPDSTELLCESLAKAYIDAPVNQCHFKADRIIDHIINGEDAEVGKILRQLVYAQAKEWADK